MLRIANPTNSKMIGWFPFTVPCIGKDNVDHLDGLRLCPARNRLTGVPLPDVAIRYGTRMGSARCAWADLDVDANSCVDVDIAKGVGCDYHADPVIPPDVLADPNRFFLPTVNGTVLQLVVHDGSPLEFDGPAVRVHYRGLVGSSTWADLWLAWVPEEHFYRFELLLNTAHPLRAAQFMVETFPRGLLLTIGTSKVFHIGAKEGVLMAGDSMAQGQGRAFCGLGYWPDRTTERDMEQIGPMLTGAPYLIDQRWRDVVAGMGVAQLGGRFDLQAWLAAKLGRALETPYTWNTSGLMLGVTPNSGVTGSQEEQCFGANGAEAFVDHPWAPAAVFVRYLVAMTYSRRPCHWREVWGELLDWNGHKSPRLVLLSGQPHYSSSVSPDRLGMERQTTEAERHGWYGPDREHWLYGSLWFAAQVTGSRLLQFLIEAQARVVWFGETTDPNLSTSGAGAARSVGWYGMVATALAHCLQSDATRSLVLKRTNERLQSVYLPAYGPNQYPELPKVWDARRDNRLSSQLELHYENIVLSNGDVIDRADTLPLGAMTWKTMYHYPIAWMVYQQAVGAYGLHLLGLLCKSDDALEAARVAAATCWRAGWTVAEEGMVEWECVGVPTDNAWLDASKYVQRVGAYRTGWYRGSWMPLALWVCAQNDIKEPTRWLCTLREQALTGDGALAWLPSPLHLPTPPVGDHA